MKLLYTISFSILFLIPSLGFSQDKELEKANKKYDQLAYFDAIKLYEQKIKKGYESPEIYEKLANSYYYNGDLKNASKWYSKLLSSNIDVIPEVYFRYSHSLKYEEKYNEADEMMKMYKLKISNSAPDLNDNYLERIKEQSGKYIIQNITANSPVSDFAPSFYKEQLIFSSARDTGGFSKNIHEWDNNVFNDLFIANKPENNYSFINPKSFSKKLNSKYEESTTAFTNDGKTVYFTRSNYLKGKRRKDSTDITRLKILRAKLNQNEIWGDIEELSFNSDQYSVAHPTLNNDETKLYFASDMPGGFGLSDLYVVDINIDGTFGTPKNLGRGINTEGRETFPFISKGNNLYFASDSRPGLGGLDVFAINLSSEINAKSIYNLGKPINSPSDDFSFIINDETNTGYFASNRKGGMGSDDIYAHILQIECNNIKGIVFDFHSKAPISLSKVELIDVDNQIIDSTKTDIKGVYVFNKFDCKKKYQIRAHKDNYLTNEVSVDLEEEFTNISLEKNLVTAKEGDDLGKILHLNLIYFDLGKAYIRNDAKIELEKIVTAMKKYPKLKIDIRSHTDSRSGDKFNLLLSNKRAHSTVQYIINQGIDKSRISGKGYGESQLINNCSNGVECSEEAHQLNRRSEFIIMQN